MNKYLRWSVFGLVAAGLVILWLLSKNKDARKKVEALLLERLIKNKVSDLKDKATAAQIQAQNGKIKADEAEKIAKQVEGKIIEHKQELEKKLESKGLSADEISDRFNNLSL